MSEFNTLSEKLFSDIPKGRLYHYTTLTGLLGIVDSKALWASDIRYMNDSAELKHAADLIKLEVRERMTKRQGNPDFLNQFVDWVSYRITNGNMLFASSFRSHGNLLSQWRGYSTHGKGVSLGFDAEYIVSCAKLQHFQIGKCIYEPNQQRQLIRQVVDAVENHVSAQIPENSNRAKRLAIYRKTFKKIESHLLRIAALLKHPSFREEMEWRIVSPIFSGDTGATVLFREAHAMLVPYVEFNLEPDPATPIQLNHLFLGPTSNINLSMNSLKMFLAQKNIHPAKGIDYCQIPYRQQ
jgi:hypothetical protein